VYVFIFIFYVSISTTDEVELSPGMFKVTRRKTQPLKCTLCPTIAEFPTLLQFKQHMDSLHSKHRAQCEICFTRFRNEKLLASHARNVHSTKYR